MKFIFFGTPSFSARALTKLLERGMVPAAIVCNPDRPTGRKKIMTAAPVKMAAGAWNARRTANSATLSTAAADQPIAILQPEKLDNDFAAKLAPFHADFFVVFAYNKIFRKNILSIPRLGTIGIHPSFLPKRRGASPFQTALLNGDGETGVTLYLLDEGVDSGPIIATSPAVAITDTDTFVTMADKLADAGAELLLKTAPDFLAGKIEPRAQDESQATSTKKFTAQDGFVALEALAAAEQGGTQATHIFHMIQAFNPEPGAWTTRDGKRIKLLEAKLVHENNKTALRLTKTQTEGQTPKAI